ncbi:hypothetical protein GE061_014313 [Apolygus lucorum]|uniref:RNase H type-1 domain-containing protein n=1 Tax=Apolygus lucorum TaxID=248454 RepID=A0A8S9XSJ1_APOLU|nr:hypothetical protein GE061_014313 [Apolygus lucorum]
MEIKKLMFQLEIDGISVRFIWVRSHRGIEGNDIADFNAKIAALEVPLPEATPWFPPTDLKKKIAAELTKRWRVEHENYHAGQRYVRMFPPPRLSAWFSNMPLRPKMFFKIISRLRTGHCCTKKYLLRIGKTDSELCELCSVTEDEQHIFMECPRFNITREKLFEEVSKSVAQPFNLELILQLQDVTIYDAIVKFCEDSDVTL